MQKHAAIYRSNRETGLTALTDDRGAWHRSRGKCWSSLTPCQRTLAPGSGTVPHECRGKYWSSLSSQFVPHTDKGLWNQAAAWCRTGVPHSMWSHCVLRTRNDFEVWPPEGDEYLWKNFCEGKTEIVKVRNPRLGADFNQFRGTE